MQISRQASGDPYANIAGQYQAGIDKNFTEERQRRQLLDPLDPYLSIAKNILDLGSGEGSCLHSVAQAYPDVEELIGVDNSPTMIRLSNDKVGSERVKFVLGDMADLPFANGYFDLTYARFALHHSDDLTTAMAEVARVTRPGGHFYIRDAHPFSGLFLKPSKDYETKESAEFPAWHDQNIKIEHPTHTFQEYIGAITAAGWAIVSLVERCGTHSEAPEYHGYRVPTTVAWLLERSNGTH